MARSSGKVVALRPDTLTVEAAARRFLSERDLAPSTRRVYGATLDALAADVGPDSPLTEVTAEEIEEHLRDQYGTTTPATYNRVVATLRSFLGWAMRRRLIAADPTEELERRKERRTARQAATQRAIDYPDLEALWSRKDIGLREKLLWKLLYESAARANEVLSLNVEDLDLTERSARIVGKGGGVEHLHFATGTTVLLPRYLKGRTTGPVFLADRPPRIATAKTDLDPVSGRARLSYRRAAELFTDASGGWTLHQLRHSALTHLAEDGVDVALLRAKSRHASLRSLERYVRPSEASVAKLTAQHDRARRR
jgi:integrase/recombinase XerC/integrase/recombinase XerD